MSNQSGMSNQTGINRQTGMSNQTTSNRIGMNNRYRVVEHYRRQKPFDFFSTYRNPFYATTFELDMTELKAFTDERDYSLHVNLCYFVTRAMQEIEDFHYRVLNGQLVFYEEIQPSSTVPAPDGLFNFAYFTYDADVDVFNRGAAEVIEAAGRGVQLADLEHRNGVWFTALPKVPFTSFTHASNLATDTEPQVAFGKFRQQDGRLWVPLGVQVNHTVIDGNALGELFERAQKWFSEPG